jgi:hypothetical protein
MLRNFRVQNWLQCIEDEEDQQHQQPNERPAKRLRCDDVDTPLVRLETPPSTEAEVALSMSGKRRNETEDGDPKRGSQSAGRSD